MRFLSTLLLLAATLLGFAAVPNFTNFSSKNYKSHPINYGFAQDSSGIIYIANAYSVIEYDGQSFRKIPLVAGKSAISFVQDDGGKIYVGSSSEFGYLTKDSTLKTVYKSLKHLIAGNKEINEIFNAVWLNNSIYLAALKGIYHYQNDSIVLINGFTTDTYIDKMALVKNEIVFWENGVGLGRIKGGKREIFHQDSKHYGVKAIEYIDNDYVVFGKFGIKSIRSPQKFSSTQRVLSEAHVSSVLKIAEDKFILGTVNNGIYLMNSDGELLRNFTTNHGLQDNLVRDLFKDKSGNIWIAYNNGFGVFKWDDPVQYITNSQGLDGMGYSGIVYQNSLYIGTSRGLYKKNNWSTSDNKKLFSEEGFIKVVGIPDGTINYLTIANGELIACQAAETYTIKNGEATRISDGSWFGSWIWVTADKHNKNEAFVGTYEGIERYVFKNNGWQHQGHVIGFTESSRVLEVDDRGIIWAIQGNKGLYRVKLNDARDSVVSVKNYADGKRFKSDDFNDIFYLNNKIYVTTFKGVFYIQNDSLIEDKSFAKISKYVQRARLLAENELYAIYNDQPYLLTKANELWDIKPSAVSFSRSSLVGSAEFMQKIASDCILMGTQEGFAIYQPSKDESRTNYPCLIRNIEAIDDNLNSPTYFGKPQKKQVFNYAQNNLRFTFAVPQFTLQDQIVYQTQLHLNNKLLTDWQNVKGLNFREYTNLKEGDYKFVVRAKKGSSYIPSTAYSFTISPPWYRTNIANAFYLLLFIVVGLMIRIRFKKQAEKLKAENERELEIKEKLYKAEKLEIELKNKDNELAYMALSYTQKKEMLSSLEQKLDSLSKEMEHGERTKVNSLKRTISSSIDDESNWENFQVHFDQKNDNFFQKLKQVDPKINESYLLFCSYVKMGKSNKEIAELLNISVAAVEKRKYRLKKKWGLDNEVSFTDYLRTL